MRELTIKRSEWLHTLEDLKSGSSLFRTTDKKKCCLGFYALSCGLALDQILNVPSFYHQATPAFIGVLPYEMVWLRDKFGANSEDAAQLMADNDSTYQTSEEKERRVAATFLKHDVK